MQEELLVRFLTGHNGSAFCLTCLAAMLASPRSEVIEAVDLLRARGQIAAVWAECANCYKQEVVIRRLGGT